ncbi:BTB/POZ protein [Ochromonadaceae sp. CCMP2298]|nr:BTB/POZ protein [Ochromonadaceae sp. CCMP2298]
MKRSRADDGEEKEGSDSVGEDAQEMFNKGKEIIIQDAQQKAVSILTEAADALEKASSNYAYTVKKRQRLEVEKQQLKGEKQQWEAEKAALAGVQHFESVVNLNVGGVRYTTSLTTLRRFPDSMIGCMFSGRHALTKGDDGCFFIDRDGTHFRHILNFLRSPEGFKVEIEGADKRELRRECEYYGIDQLMFGITYTEKVLECWDTVKRSYSPMTILIDSKGVYTFKHKDVIDGKIEYCPRCHWGVCLKGSSNYWALNFKERFEGGVPAAQPRVQGKCRICLKPTT